MSEVMNGGDTGLGKSATLPVSVDAMFHIDNSGAEKSRADEVVSTFEGNPFVDSEIVDEVLVSFKVAVDAAQEVGSLDKGNE